MKPKLRFYQVTGRSARGMDAAKRNAMQAVEKALAEEGGWTLVTIETRDWAGRMYDRKTDEYQLSCWMVQYPGSAGNLRPKSPVVTRRKVHPS